MMQKFLKKYEGRITGVLSGFDRVLFRGTALGIGYVKGMDQKLLELGIRYERFFTFAERVTKAITAHADELAKQSGRPVVHLNSSKSNKEELARTIQEQDGIREGLICVITCVETCQTYALRRRGEKNWLTLVPERRKCKFLYFYLVDPEFGFMHVRLQTWLPMTIQVCINGREYLARQLDGAGIGYDKRGNCFVSIDDLPRAQELLSRLHRLDWAAVLSRFSRRFNPWCAAENEIGFRGYYWSFRESEYATDMMFRDAAALGEIYPGLVRHAMDHFLSPDVLRFFSRRLTKRFAEEITTDIKDRHEGVRIKHRTEENSIKMYDKQRTLLRIETTINEPKRFKVRRQAVRQGREVLAWFHLRKGIADTQRRVEICHAANGRYLDALAEADIPAPAHKVLDPVSRPIVRRGRRYRALRPLSPDDSRLLRILLSGAYHLPGFRNRDIYHELYGPRRYSGKERRRASSRITRWLRLLRAHGLIRKVSHTFNYRVTAKGQRVITTALKLRELNLSALAA